MKNLQLLNANTITKICDTACIIAISYCISSVFHDAVENKIVPVIQHNNKSNITSVTFTCLENKEEDEKSENNEVEEKRSEPIAQA